MKNEDFNLALLKIVIEDAVALKNLREVLKPQHFPNKYLRKIFSITLDFFTTYQTPLNFAILKDKIEKEFTENARIPYLALLKELEGLKIENKAYILDSLVEFLTLNSLNEKVLEVKTLLEANDWKNAELVFDNFKSTKHGSKILEQIKDGETTVKLGATAKRKTDDVDVLYTKTIWEPFNAVFREGKGLPGKSLVVIQASSNYGKTRTLVASVISALKQGRKCFFVTCEMSADDIDELICSLLTQEEIDKFSSNLLILEIRASKAFINSIDDKIHQAIEENFKPDMIAFDSIGNIKVDPKLRLELGLINDNMKVEYIAERARDLAKDLDLIFLTVWQTNRAGLREIAIDQSFVSKAIEIFQVADVYIITSQGLNQPEDEHYISLIKSRYGEKFKYMVQRWNPALCKAEIIQTLTKEEIVARMLEEGKKTKK